MMPPIPLPLIAIAVLIVMAALWLAVRSWIFLIFLAGGFFVSGGVLGYLWFAGVGVPIIGLGMVQTPEVSGLRSLMHLLLSGACLYFGLRRARRAMRH